MRHYSCFSADAATRLWSAGECTIGGWPARHALNTYQELRGHDRRLSRSHIKGPVTRHTSFPLTRCKYDHCARSQMRLQCLSRCLACAGSTGCSDGIMQLQCVSGCSHPFVRLRDVCDDFVGRNYRMQRELAAAAGSRMRRLWHMHQLRSHVGGSEQRTAGFYRAQWS